MNKITNMCKRPVRSAAM